MIIWGIKWVTTASLTQPHAASLSVVSRARVHVRRRPATPSPAPVPLENRILALTWAFPVFRLLARIR